MDDSTTKVCRKCGQTKPLTAFHKQKKNPDGLQYWCKDCKREENRQRGDYFKQRHAAKRDQINKQQSTRYHTDVEFRERKKREERARSKTPEARKREQARYNRDRRGNPEYNKKRVDYARNRRHNDPEYRRKVCHWRRVRQARIQLQGTPFTHAEWVALCERYDHRCLCCGQKKPLTADHVVPISCNGSSDISNIQPLCMDCNRRKSAKTIDYRPDM